CARCHATANANGTPVLVVAVKDGRDVFACSGHQAELAAPAGDPVVAIAQYQDMARRRRAGR
ncbi:hypothetical protein, partial [Streptomyces sp. NPDC058103]